MVLGVFGNIVVILTNLFVLRNVNNERYFIPVLATTDLLACVVCFLFSVMTDSAVVIQNFRSSTLCKVGNAVAGIPVNFCISTLFCIAVQRYTKICKNQRLTLHRRRCMIFISLVISVVISLPATLTVEMKIFEVANDTLITECSYAETSIATGYWITTSVLILMIYVSFIFCYGQIALVLYRHFKNMKCNKAKTTKLQSSERHKYDNNIKKAATLRSIIDDNHSDISYADLVLGNSEGNTNIEIVSTNDLIESDRGLQNTSSDSKTIKATSVKRAKRNEKLMIKFTLMFVIMTSVFLVTTLPIGIVYLMSENIPNFWRGLSIPQAQVVICCRRLFILSYCLNPIIYAFMDMEFRTGAKILLRTCNTRFSVP